MPGIRSFIPTNEYAGDTAFPWSGIIFWKLRTIFRSQMHSYKPLADCLIEDNLERIVFAPWRAPDYLVVLVALEW
jgi:hypothetical protein